METPVFYYGITCAHCHQGRKTVELWSQIVALRDPQDVVCCWIEGLD